MVTTESNVFKASNGQYMLVEEQHTSAVLQQIWAQETEVFKKQQEMRTQVYKDATEKMAKLKAKEAQGLSEIERAEIEELQQTLDGIARMESDAQNKRLAQEQRARKISEKYAENSYKRMSLIEKIQYNKKVRDQLVTERDALKQKEKMIKAAIETETDAVKKAELEEQLKGVQAQTRQTTKKISEHDKQPGIKDIAKDPRKLAQPLMSAYDLVSTANKKHAAESAVAAQARLRAAKQEQQEIKNSYKLSKEYRDAERANDRAKMDDLEKQIQKTEEYQQALAEEAEAKRDILNAELENAFAKTKDFSKQTTDAINKNIEAMYGQQGRMLGRLQGAQFKWAEAVDNISDTIGVSGMVNKKNVIAKMVELVDSGVAYNLEMRAFLAETSENIASTFNATNGTLLRLIRLQQADTTAARLGMEATLTKFLNANFKDTSYLTDNISEAVTAAVLDASMTMSKNASLEFEYVLQKWMSALYSLGMSAENVQNIATAINYLGTGNVSALNSNESLQTLLAMSATKAGGKSYADMLTQGIDASDTNKLLKAMVEYLSEIASTQTNMVTKSAYSEIFGMNITDLSAFTSLKTSDIHSIFSQNVSYESLTKETENQLKAIPGRLNLTEYVTNVIDNAMVGAADVIGSDAITYGTWQALKLLTDNVDEVKVPGVPNLDLINVAEIVMSGISLVATLIGALGGLGADPTTLSNWKFDEYNTELALCLDCGVVGCAIIYKVGKEYEVVVAVGHEAKVECYGCVLVNNDHLTILNWGVVVAIDATGVYVVYLQRVAKVYICPVDVAVACRATLQIVDSAVGTVATRLGCGVARTCIKVGNAHC